jgi:hypothetical protein
MENWCPRLLDDPRAAAEIPTTQKYGVKFSKCDLIEKYYARWESNKTFNAAQIRGLFLLSFYFLDDDVGVFVI